MFKLGAAGTLARLERWLAAVCGELPPVALLNELDWWVTLKKDTYWCNLFPRLLSVSFTHLEPQGMSICC